MSSPPGQLDLASVAALEGVAQSLGLQLQRFEVRSAADLPSAGRALERMRPHGLLVFDQPVTLGALPAIIELAARLRLTSCSQSSRWVRQGGLLSYAADVDAQLRRAAGYVDRIIRGAKPADLPVEQPTRFELVINAKTAHALGLTIPPVLLLRADAVLR